VAGAAETNGEGSASLVQPTSSSAGRVLSGSDARGRQKKPRAVNHAAARCAEAGAGPQAVGRAPVEERASRWCLPVWTLEALGEPRANEQGRIGEGGGTRVITDKDLTADIRLEKYLAISIGLLEINKLLSFFFRFQVKSHPLI